MQLQLRQPEPAPVVEHRPRLAQSVDGQGDADNAVNPMVLHARVVTGSGGGPDKTILRSIRYADQLGVRMGAAYIYPKSDRGISTLREQADAWQCPFWPIPESGPIDPRTVAATLRLCRRKRVRIWHGHDYKSNLLGLLLKPLWPMKLVTTVHGWTRETARTRLYYHVDQWCLPRYDHVVTVSGKLTEHCRKLGIPDDRVTFIPNGIDQQEHQRRYSIPDARRRLGINQRAKAIAVVGRLSKEKGVDRALRAFVAIKDRCPNAELHIVGNGPEGPALRQLAEQLNLHDQVHFWGWQNDTSRFFEAMDLVLLPSRTEGLPNVLLEAMSIGVPCAATDVGAVRHLLDHGRCGLILGDRCADWATTVAPCLMNPYRLASMQQQARLRVSQHFSFADRMAHIGKVYDLVLGRITSGQTDTTTLRRAA